MHVSISFSLSEENIDYLRKCKNRSDIINELLDKKRGESRDIESLEQKKKDALAQMAASAAIVEEAQKALLDIERESNEQNGAIREKVKGELKADHEMQQQIAKASERRRAEIMNMYKDSEVAAAIAQALTANPKLMKDKKWINDAISRLRESGIAMASIVTLEEYIDMSAERKV